MLATSEIGRRGQLIARYLWPSLRLVEEASEDDRHGRDGFLRTGTYSVQVKTDARIAQTGNIYIELYEKTKGSEDQVWRHSPNDSAATIFVTEGFAVWISTDEIAKAMVGARVAQVNPTSIGILVCLSDIPKKLIRPHNLWAQKMLI